MIISEQCQDTDFSRHGYFVEPHLRRLSCYSELALKAVEPIESIYVPHVNFMTAVTAIERLYGLASHGIDLPYGLCIHGPDLTGKWSAVQYFYKSHVSRELFESKNHEILMMRAIRSPRAEPLLSSMLREFGYPIKFIGPGSLEARINIVVAGIKHKRKKIIFVRHAHNLLSQDRGGRISSSATDVLTQIMDECKVGIVLIGSDRLLSLKDFDSTFASRIQTYERLGNFSALPHWLEFMKSFFSKCDRFDFEFFWADGQPEKLYGLCAGNPGHFKMFVVECALCAAQRGSRDVSAPDAKNAFRALFGAAALIANPYENDQ